MTSEWSQNVALDRNKLNTGQTCYNSESLQTNTVASFPMTCSTSFLLRLTQFLFDTSRLLASPALLLTHKEPPSFYTVSIIYALMLFALSWAIFRNLLTGLVRHAKLFKKNTVFPRIIAGGDYFFFRTKRGAVIRGKAIIRGRRLIQILLTESRALTSLISFAESHYTPNWQGGDKRKRRWREGRGRGDYFKYLRQRGAISRGRRLIEGRLFFEEIRYAGSADHMLHCSVSCKHNVHWSVMRETSRPGTEFW